LEVGRFPRFGIEGHEIWYFEDVHLFTLVRSVEESVRLAYLAIAGLRPGLPGKIEVHDNLLLLLHLLLFICGIVASAILSAVIVTRVEFHIVKLSSWGSER